MGDLAPKTLNNSMSQTQSYMLWKDRESADVDHFTKYDRTMSVLRSRQVSLDEKQPEEKSKRRAK